MFTAVIPKNKFPTGVVQFTLFSQSGEPLNERLAFINNGGQLKLNANRLTKSYTPRQMVMIELGAMDKAGKPATGSFSVAVTDETAVPVDTLNENSILSNLLLTSDLKGTVEQPNYYFISQNENARADLDVLMLTQGYRHFEWKKILSNTQPPAAYLPERSLQISGSVIKHSKPAVGAKVTLFSNRGGLFMLDTVADKDGKFAFKDLVFGDSTKFIVQSKVPKGQFAVTLELDTVAAPQMQMMTNRGSHEPTGMAPYLKNQKRFYDEQKKAGINTHPIMLKEIVIRNRKYFLKRSKNLNGAGHADMVLTADDLKDTFGPTLSAALLTKAAMYIDFKRGVPYNRMHSMTGGPMLTMLDGFEVESDVFNRINPEDIQSMEIMVSPNYSTTYGARGGGGVIEITTKRNSDYERYTPGVIVYHPQGYYKAREFYSPQYDNPKTNQKINDFRSTIYWKPDVITDKGGKASFSYFNSDNKGTYRVVIEGIDADGNLGRQVYRYTVE